MQLPGKGRDLTEAGAIRCAYRLLSYRDRSEKELIERLKKKGFAEDTVRNTISHLKGKGFIDDVALAASLKKTAEDVKLLGAQGVRLFLRHRGLSKEIIGDVLIDSDPDELIRAKKLVDRKLRAMEDCSDEEIRKKIWRFLVRKGYSSGTIRKVFKQFEIEEEEE